jgi:hypothetical protein
VTGTFGAKMSHLSGSAPFPVKSCSYVTDAIAGKSTTLQIKEKIWGIRIDFVSDVLGFNDCVYFITQFLTINF